MYANKFTQEQKENKDIKQYFFIGAEICNNSKAIVVQCFDCINLLIDKFVYIVYNGSFIIVVNGVFYWINN